METFRYLSWGKGVQSTWILVMAGLGMIDKIDAAIVADLEWEGEDTKRTFEYYKKWAENKGIKIEVVSSGNIRELGAKRHIHIPFWTVSGAPLRRQCTFHFKILPIRRRMRELSGFDASKCPHPASGQVNNLLGISWDEWERMSSSDVRYIVHEYPLIQRKINRWDCIEGFNKLGLPVPAKSSCIGCPYKDASSWLNMKVNNPVEFEDACKFDEENRSNLLVSDGSTSESIYLWRGRVPLRQVDLERESLKQKQGKQVPLFVCTGQECFI